MVCPEDKKAKSRVSSRGIKKTVGPRGWGGGGGGGGGGGEVGWGRGVGGLNTLSSPAQRKNHPLTATGYL